MRNKVFYLVTILILAAVLAACGGAATAQGLPQTQSGSNEVSNLRTLSVNGNGKVYLTPDIAYVNIGVHTEGRNAEEAVAGNSAQTQEVIDALKSAGIAASDIQTMNFSIYPQQQYDSTGRPTGEITYMVDNTVFVTLRNLDQIGELLDTAVKAGANSINGIQFDVADKTAAMSEARKAAVTDAREQAEELAQTAGVQLGEIHSINAVSTGYPPMPFFDGRGGAAAVESAVPVSPGQLTISVDVNVVYSIR